jgi:Uncharacterized protein conserved in bacteria (DUF2252)
MTHFWRPSTVDMHTRSARLRIRRGRKPASKNCPSSRDDTDPLLLQVKEAQPSVLENYLGPSGCTNAAERVVEGQRLMQASGDILLGWLRCVGPDGHEADYYVRQLRDWKGSAEVESTTPQLLADYGRSCAEVLARAHASYRRSNRNRELSRQW